MITKQRNDLVEHAKNMQADYIFFIDTDMVIPPDSLVRLLKHDKDVVGATYCKRVPPYETLGKLKGNQPTDDELRAGGLREAELLPAGVLLVKVSVFERIGWPHFWESYQWPGENGVEALKNFLRSNYSTFAPEDALTELDGLDKLKVWLNATWEAESKAKWQYFSEDLNFFRRLVKAGISAWCDLELTFQCKHLGTHEVTCLAPAKPTVIAAAVM
jgi:glycosyltransferase involved in cell wall biosynthesis